MIQLTRRFVATLPGASRDRPELQFGSDQLGPPQNARFWDFVFGERLAADLSVPFSEDDLSLVLDEFLFTTDYDRLSAFQRSILGLAALEWLSIRDREIAFFEAVLGLERFEDLTLIDGPRREIVVDVLTTIASGVSLRKRPIERSDQIIAGLLIDMLQPGRSASRSSDLRDDDLTWLCERLWRDERVRLATVIERWLRELPGVDAATAIAGARWARTLRETRPDEEEDDADDVEGIERDLD